MDPWTEDAYSNDEPPLPSEMDWSLYKKCYHTCTYDFQRTDLVEKKHVGALWMQVDMDLDHYGDENLDPLVLETTCLAETWKKVTTYELAYYDHQDWSLTCDALSLDSPFIPSLSLSPFLAVPVPCSSLRSKLKLSSELTQLYTYGYWVSCCILIGSRTNWNFINN